MHHITAMSALLYPLDSIRWILWISLCFAAAAAVCRDFTVTALMKKKFIDRLAKFAGYIHNHKILSRNIFDLILKNKMAATAIFSTFSKDFCWSSKAKGIIGRDLKFARYVHHYKILTGNILASF